MRLLATPVLPLIPKPGDNHVGWYAMMKFCLRPFHSIISLKGYFIPVIGPYYMLLPKVQLHRNTLFSHFIFWKNRLVPDKTVLDSQTKETDQNETFYKKALQKVFGKAMRRPNKILYRSNLLVMGIQNFGEGSGARPKPLIDRNFLGYAKLSIINYLSKFSISGQRASEHRHSLLSRQDRSK